MSKKTERLVAFPITTQPGSGMIYGHCEDKDSKLHPFAVHASDVKGFIDVGEDRINVMIDGRLMTVIATVASFDQAYQRAREGK